MARLIVSAAVTQLPREVVLIVSVSGADDGLARGDLTGADFAVYQLSGQQESDPLRCAVDRVAEGPAGCYRLALAPASLQPEAAADRAIFCVVVGGPTEGGWADDRGQAIATGAVAAGLPQRLP